MTKKKIKIVIGSELEDVRMADIIAERLCTCSGIPDEICSEIRLCTVEAVNNCILHAYGQKSGKEVEILFCFCPDRVMLQVCDSGTPMDCSLSDMPRRHSCNPDNEDIPVCGRGFNIIKAVMDTVEYVRDNEKNCLIMTKTITKKLKRT